MIEKVYGSLKKNWKTIAIFSAIFIVAVFLRTYNFHDWLEFRYDQARDAHIVNDVITSKSAWPLMGPKMSYTGLASNNDEAGAFRLGPIYYYFQIISAKIFGDSPDKLAYPDVLFSILSVPLLYFFLKIYFNRKLSLGLTGLYAISAYFIHYSRLAWNSNPVPFFALLFLFSLYKFLEKKEETHWAWIVCLGIAMGVGFQLHAITMALFPATAFFAFLFLMKKNRKVWGKWAVVLLVFIVLNLSQIISEVRTNFSNTKSFFNFPVERNVGNTSIFTLVKNDTICHIKSNFIFLSSYGEYGDGNEKKCSSYFSEIMPSGREHYLLKDMTKLIILLSSLVFSIVGYFFLVYYNKKETEETKKHFLRLIILYFVIGYIIMFFISGERMSYERYFRFGFFVPYVFLGFLIKLMSEKFAKFYIMPTIVLFLLLIVSNAVAISKEVSPLLEKNRTCSSHIATLGEIKPVADYIIYRSKNQDMIYFGVDTSTLPAFAKPLEYLFERRGVSSYNVGGVKETYFKEIDGSAFILGCKPKKSFPYSYEKINNIYIYQINK